MTELGEIKINLQLPEELHKPLLFEEFNDGKEEKITGWLVEHFISSSPDASGPTILCYNPERTCYEAIIKEESSENEIRQLIRIERDKFNNPTRTDLGFWLINKTDKSIEPVTQYEDRSPNVVLP